MNKKYDVNTIAKALTNLNPVQLDTLLRSTYDEFEDKVKHMTLTKQNRAWLLEFMTSQLLAELAMAKIMCESKDLINYYKYKTKAYGL